MGASKMPETVPKISRTPNTVCLSTLSADLPVQVEKRIRWVTL